MASQMVWICDQCGKESREEPGPGWIKIDTVQPLPKFYIFREEGYEVILLKGARFRERPIWCSVDCLLAWLQIRFTEGSARS